MKMPAAMNKIKNKGIGLLELMLSLAIIAILLIMAIRYYQSANLSQQMSSATDMFNAVRSAMKNFYNDNAGNSGGQSQASINSLIASGYLPPSFGVNPWGGSVGLSSDAASCTLGSLITPGPTYGVCMNNVPTAACGQLKIKLDSTINSNLGEQVTACGTGTSLLVTYAYG